MQKMLQESLHCIALVGAKLYCTALHYIALHCTVLYCTTLHCTALHCTALHCTAKRCTERLQYNFTMLRFLQRIALVSAVLGEKSAADLAAGWATSAPRKISDPGLGDFGRCKHNMKYKSVNSCQTNNKYNNQAKSKQFFEIHGQINGRLGV